MAKINRNRLISIVTKGMAGTGYSAAIQTVKQIHLEAKEFALDKFNNHKVTKEIEGGPKGPSTSGVLSGAKGNLFSFIGFKIGAYPTQAIRDALGEIDTAKASAPSQRKIDKVNGIATFSFSAYVPTDEYMEKVALSDTPRRISERSWVWRIENGFDNLNYYLYKRSGFKAKSHSGTGLQVGRQVHRGLVATPTPYVSHILAEITAKTTGVRVSGFWGGAISFKTTNYDRTFKGFFDKMKGLMGKMR